MATKYVTIGSLVEFHQYDDTEFPYAFETDGMVYGGLGGWSMGPPMLEVVVDFSAVGWCESGTHELFTVVGGGRVHGFIQFYCTEALTPGGSTLQAGTASDTDKFFPATTCTDFVAGDLWASDGTATKSVLENGMVEFWTSEDIGYQLVNASTNGTGTFSLWWEAVDSGVSVVAGAGGAL